MQTTSERIKQALEIRNMKQADLIEKTGISKGALSSYISGRYIPKQSNTYLLAKALDVDPAWLMGLDVPMESKTNDYEIATLVNKVRKDEQVQELLQIYYNELSDENKKRVIDIVKALGGH